MLVFKGLCENISIVRQRLAPEGAYSLVHTTNSEPKQHMAASLTERALPAYGRKRPF